MLINSAYKEERWIHTYCHVLSKQVIHFCLLQGCGKILTEVPGKLRRSGSEGADKPLILGAEQVLRSSRIQGQRIEDHDREDHRSERKPTV